MLTNIINANLRIQSILSRFTPSGASSSGTYAWRPEEAQSPAKAITALSQLPPRKALSQSQDFDRLVEYFSARSNLPPSLVHAVIKTESNYNPKAVSVAGAKGLMQLMDSTAASLGVTDPFDPTQNIAGGARYLQEMLTRFKSLPNALAAYNAGPEAVKHYGGVPPYRETREFVRRVLGLQQEYEP